MDATEDLASRRHVTEGMAGRRSSGVRVSPPDESCLCGVVWIRGGYLDSVK